MLQLGTERHRVTVVDVSQTASTSFYTPTTSTSFHFLRQWSTMTNLLLLLLSTSPIDLFSLSLVLKGSMILGNGWLWPLYVLAPGVAVVTVGLDVLIVIAPGSLVTLPNFWTNRKTTKKKEFIILTKMNFWQRLLRSERRAVLSTARKRFLTLLVALPELAISTTAMTTTTHISPHHSHHLSTLCSTKSIDARVDTRSQRSSWVKKSYHRSGKHVHFYWARMVQGRDWENAMFEMYEVSRSRSWETWPVQLEQQTRLCPWASQLLHFTLHPLRNLFHYLSHCSQQLSCHPILFNFNLSSGILQVCSSYGYRQWHIMPNLQEAPQESYYQWNCDGTFYKIQHCLPISSYKIVWREWVLPRSCPHPSKIFWAGNHWLECCRPWSHAIRCHYLDERRWKVYQKVDTPARLVTIIAVGSLSVFYKFISTWSLGLTHLTSRHWKGSRATLLLPPPSHFLSVMKPSHLVNSDGLFARSSSRFVHSFIFFDFSSTYQQKNWDDSLLLQIFSNDMLPQILPHTILFDISKLTTEKLFTL